MKKCHLTEPKIAGMGQDAIHPPTPVLFLVAAEPYRAREGIAATGAAQGRVNCARVCTSVADKARR
jgi:hypothetical protein